MTNQKICSYCHRPFAKSSDAWMKLAGSSKPDEPQKKDYCGVVGDKIHGNALSSCEKWERIFLRGEVKRLDKELKEANKLVKIFSNELIRLLKIK